MGVLSFPGFLGIDPLRPELCFTLLKGCNVLLRSWKLLALLGACLLLASCGGILDPKGQVASHEKTLILVATGLMLIVVLPVIFMTIYFAWRYRASRINEVYDPKWSRSHAIEAVIWLIPLVIILVLGTITWRSTHVLDPYKPLDDQPPLVIEVVSLNWKWLFIYPEQGIATVNELVFPAHQHLQFKLTSESTMNSFFIPQLGSQIYCMAGMETKLHLVADEPGEFQGFSANYSGAGFSGMKFIAMATSPEAFADWVDEVKSAPNSLDQRQYQQLAEPSEAHAIEYFAQVEKGLFQQVMHKYMKNYNSWKSKSGDHAQGQHSSPHAAHQSGSASASAKES